MQRDSNASNFASQMAFKKSWRPYQARVIDRLDYFLRDRHFHLVSAPGSGKTVLGLEVIRALGKNTLVFTPTLAIREQWIDRLIEDYLGPDQQGDGSDISWLSRDLAEPGELTISTYQSVSSEFRKEDGINLITKIQEAGISVIVVDEAHHLRAVWWKCLTEIKESIPDVFVVALTATPPVDVPQAEWNRYAEFCGEVDEEVGIPELVAEGNLCPHQDYLLLSTPDDEDVAELQRFVQGVSSFVLDMQIDVEFAERLSAFQHWITDEELRDRKYLRSHQEHFFALAIYMQKVGGRIPIRIREVYSIDDEEIPDLDVDWIEILLQGLLYEFREKIEFYVEQEIEPYEADDSLADDELADELRLHEEKIRNRKNARKLIGDIKRLRRRLSELGAIERKKVILNNTEQNEKVLQNSPAKIYSVAEIIEHELVAQKILMRAVILTDHIRKDAFPSIDSDGMVDEPPFAKLGVVPIFEMLRRMRLPGLMPGILSGSLMVIPKTAESDFRCIARDSGIGDSNLCLKLLPHDSDFLLLEVRDSDRYRAVSAITELFSQGSINCLVGTASLLGEGWDSPELNTLVLASVIGSFVMSNQMRGRAIRSSPMNASKTANIWHIATIPPDLSPMPVGKKPSQYRYDSGNDYRKLIRRFEAFHGIGMELSEPGKALIESGLSRLGLGGMIHFGERDEINRRMLNHAEDRIGMELIWRKAIPPKESGRFLRPVRSLSAPPRMAASSFMATLRGDSEKGIRAMLANWLESRRLDHIAMAVLLSLHRNDEKDHGLFLPEAGKWKVRITRIKNRFHVSAPDLDSHTQARFIQALDEFFDVFSNPRYLIHQKGRWFAVPKRLGSSRIDVEYFSRMLRKQGFGRHRIHYAHDREGPDYLLEARKQSLLRHFEFRTEARVRWEATGDPKNPTLDL